MTAALRRWRTEDAPVLVAAMADPELQRQLPPIGDLVEARAHISRVNNDVARLAWAITVDDVAVGNVAAQVDDRMRSAWVSYWLVADARGQGLATRALVALADHLFATGTHRLVLGHRLDNPASQRVAERAGFVREGIMREELEYDGVRYDTAQMSRLVHDPRPDVEPLRQRRE